MKLKKYKLGELIEVTRGASLSGEYYATQGEYIRLTCGNFDYHNNCFKEHYNKTPLFAVRYIPQNMGNISFFIHFDNKLIS